MSWNNIFSWKTFKSLFKITISLHHLVLFTNQGKFSVLPIFDFSISSKCERTAKQENTCINFITVIFLYFSGTDVSGASTLTCVKIAFSQDVKPKATNLHTLCKNTALP